MFSHKQVWAAIDALAQDNDMSVSKLARTAGLDATTFNKSKRIGADGRQRWPSTESLSKIMDATKTDIDGFMATMRDGQASFAAGFAGMSETGGTYVPDAPGHPVPVSIPLLGLAQAGSGGFFDDAGLPTGEGWEAVEFPQSDREPLYALEIAGDSMEPLYRDGDRIVVSPTASVRRGDRVVVRTSDGEIMAKTLARQTAKTVELDSENPEHQKRTFDLTEVDWVARIMWVSQ
ncbi:helix-turn-helix transcriptional regulator [Ahrensia sp. R2A130]|uniref:S24 family peptidase n=1 Tax=Ahrensia sp. R2A130 TaxID=744979 RepID=UPI0001E0CA2E|nr:helix-turn-helix transcriptional regulator [Ahrensia sp. R2A130]EFL87872.1 dna-binding protein rdga [Ahrensia sp. R2A130]